MLTVMHEESGTGMAHGYSKVAGKPMALLFHGTVGLQHATMGIYNAWCDRVPLVLMVGNHMDAATRPPGVPTTHSAQDPLSLIRDFTKWDDQPASLQAYAESMVRAYKIAMTPPMEPVAIALDVAPAGAPAERRVALHSETDTDRTASGRRQCGARGRAPAGQRRAAGDRRRSRGAHPQWDARLVIARRSAVRAGCRSGRTPQHPDHPLSQSEWARRGAGRAGRCDPRPRADRSLWHAQQFRRQWARDTNIAPQARHQGHQPRRWRSLHPCELSGLPALRRGGHFHRRRCGNDPSSI